MRNLPLFTAIVLASVMFAEDVKPPAAAERVFFDGATLTLDSTKLIAGELTAEYLSEGEKPDSWTRKAVIHDYSSLGNPAEEGNKALQAFRLKDPSPCAMWSVPKTEDVILLFFTLQKSPPGASLTIVRYSRKHGGGIRTQSYSRRIFTESVESRKEFFRSHLKLVELMGTEGLRKQPN